jgi:hypothetical protein
MKYWSPEALIYSGNHEFWSSRKRTSCQIFLNYPWVQAISCAWNSESKPRSRITLTGPETWVQDYPNWFWNLGPGLPQLVLKPRSRITPTGPETSFQDYPNWSWNLGPGLPKLVLKPRSRITPTGPETSVQDYPNWSWNLGPGLSQLVPGLPQLVLKPRFRITPNWSLIAICRK